MLNPLEKFSKWQESWKDSVNCTEMTQLSHGTIPLCFIPGDCRAADNDATHRYNG